METRIIEKVDEIIKNYELTVEEMICIRGGDGSDVIFIPTPPKPRI